MGLRKHLSTAEIVEQAVFARRLFSDEFGSITNVVFMVSILLMVTNGSSFYGR
jgi:adenine C2-methylase RlmN of 23S rRNA A2503 and tRNA A37